MPYLVGGSFDNLLAQFGALPLDVMVTYLDQAASALDDLAAAQLRDKVDRSVECLRLDVNTANVAQQMRIRTRALRGAKKVTELDRFLVYPVVRAPVPHLNDVDLFRDLLNRLLAQMASVGIVWVLDVDKPSLSLDPGGGLARCKSLWNLRTQEQTDELTLRRHNLFADNNLQLPSPTQPSSALDRVVVGQKHRS